jgi:hypothetical protein
LQHVDAGYPQNPGIDRQEKTRIPGSAASWGAVRAATGVYIPRFDGTMGIVFYTSALRDDFLCARVTYSYRGAGSIDSRRPRWNRDFAIIDAMNYAFWMMSWQIYHFVARAQFC